MVVPLDEPPAEGQQVDVEVTVDLRLPYMQIAPDEVRHQPRDQPPVARRPLEEHPMTATAPARVAAARRPGQRHQARA